MLALPRKRKPTSPNIDGTIGEELFEPKAPEPGPTLEPKTPTATFWQRNSSAQDPISNQEQGANSKTAILIDQDDELSESDPCIWSTSSWMPQPKVHVESEENRFQPEARKSQDSRKDLVVVPNYISDACRLGSSSSGLRNHQKHRFHPLNLLTRIFRPLLQISQWMLRMRTRFLLQNRVMIGLRP